MDSIKSPSEFIRLVFEPAIEEVDDFTVIEITPLPPSQVGYVRVNSLADPKFVESLDLAIRKLNLNGEKDVYFSMTLHDLVRVQKRVEACLKEKGEKKRVRVLKPTLPFVYRVAGLRANSEVSTKLSTFLVADIDLKQVHADKRIDNINTLKEHARALAGEIVEKLKELGIPPNVVVYTGGGLQVYWLFDRLVDLSELFDKNSGLGRKLVSGFEEILPDNVSVDNIYEPARVVRIPLTLNYKYEVGVNGERIGVMGEIFYLDVGRRWRDFREIVDKFVQLAKVSSTHEVPTDIYDGVSTLAFYDYSLVGEDELAQRLFEHLKVFWELRKTGVVKSRQALSMALLGYLFKTGKVKPVPEEVARWKRIFGKFLELLVKEGLEDENDIIGRRLPLVDRTVERVLNGEPLATTQILVDEAGMSEDLAKAFIKAIKNAVAIVRIKGSHVDMTTEPFPLGKAPQSWAHVDPEIKDKIVHSFLVSLYISTEEFLYLESITSPESSTFFKLPSAFFIKNPDDTLTFNRDLFLSFAQYFGIDPSRAYLREELISLIKSKWDVNDQKVRFAAFQKLRQQITPPGLRIPPCIDDALRKLILDGSLQDDYLKHTAAFAKAYGAPYTTSLIEVESDPDQKKLAIWEKIITIFGDPEIKEDLLNKFKEYYYDEENTFPCSANLMLPVRERKCLLGEDFGWDRKCPFVFPKPEILEKVNLYVVDVVRINGSRLKVQIGYLDQRNNAIVTKTLEPKYQPVKLLKNSVKYPVAEEVLKALLNGKALDSANKEWLLRSVTLILLSKMREVSISETASTVVEQFKEFLEEILTNVKPKEMATTNAPFIDEERGYIGIPTRLISTKLLSVNPHMPQKYSELYQQLYEYDASMFPKEWLDAKTSRERAKFRIYMMNPQTKKKSQERFLPISLSWIRKTLGVEPVINNTPDEFDVDVDSLDALEEDL